MSSVRVEAEAPTPQTWPQIEALLHPAIARAPDQTPWTLIDDLLSQQAQLWVARDDHGPIGACVTELVDFPTERVLHCSLIGGRGMGDWLSAMHDRVLIQAKAIGVHRFTMEGRVGWKRVLSALGWRDNAGVMELSLCGQ